jgi:pimeloyl-ACP methyl ester carboxylesterase
MERVSHDGRTTAYRFVDRGSTGPGLVCVHGSGGNHRVWAGQYGNLAREYPVAAVDLSGHGDSEDVDARPGAEVLEAYSDDVLAVAEETGAGVLAGNSLGGAVVLNAAIERGYDADALVLVGTGAKLSVRADLLGWLEDDFERAIGALHREDWLLHTRDDAALERSKETMRAVGRSVTHRDFATCDRFDVRDRLDRVDAPTLALTGEHDQLTPPWYHEYLAEELPAGTYAELDGAAHLTMLERPDAFNERVTRFLDDL